MQQYQPSNTTPHKQRKGPIHDITVSQRMKKKKTSHSVNLVSGMVAGLVTDCALHPLDMVKTRMQAQSSVTQMLYRNTAHAFGTIVRQEGLRGPYRGLVAALMGAVPTGAVYFGVYEMSKQKLMQDTNMPKWTIYLLSGAIGDFISSIVYVPTDVVKQRQMLLFLQRQGHSTLSIPQQHIEKYNSAWRGLVTLVKHEGMRGAFSGYGATLLRDVPYSAVQFLIYESLKSYIIQENRRRRQLLANGNDMVSSSESSETEFRIRDKIRLSTPQALFCGATAGTLSAVLTHPFDVVKMRIQTKHAGQPIFQTIKSIYNVEGGTAFTKGMIPRTMWFTFSSGIMFGVYEICRHLLAGTAIDIDSLTDKE